MPRSEKSRTARTAEKMLKDAIAAETMAVQAELSAAMRENDRLRGVLASIGRIAAQDGATAQTVQTVVLPPAQPAGQPVRGPTPAEIVAQREAGIPEGPASDLAGEDNLGEGRWA